MMFVCRRRSCFVFLVCIVHHFFFIEALFAVPIPRPQLIGQPVLIGGTMGTCSYVLTGTDKGFKETFGSTCHGAGRALSRAKSRRTLDYTQVRGGANQSAKIEEQVGPSQTQLHGSSSFSEMGLAVVATHQLLHLQSHPLPFVGSGQA